MTVTGRGSLITDWPRAIRRRCNATHDDAPPLHPRSPPFGSKISYHPPTLTHSSSEAYTSHAHAALDIPVAPEFAGTWSRRRSPCSSSAVPPSTTARPPYLQPCRRRASLSLCLTPPSPPKSDAVLSDTVQPPAEYRKAIAHSLSPTLTSYTPVHLNLFLLPCVHFLPTLAISVGESLGPYRAYSSSWSWRHPHSLQHVEPIPPPTL